MTHLKRIAMPKSFPLRRKGREKFIVSSIGNAREVPLLLILRDICKVAKTRKEAKTLLNAGEILANGKKVSDERLSMHLFDTLSIKKLAKHYRIILKNNKFSIQEISEKESHTRTCKIINKKILSKGKVQLNLDNGYNIISDLKAAANDSVILDFQTGKITRHLPLREKMHVEIIGGSHTGVKGIINRIEGSKAEIKIKEGIITIPIKNILVVENEG